MAPGFLEKSCSRTLRSICNHLHWPLKEQTWTHIKTHLQIWLILSTNKKKRLQFTYLSSKNASPKNSFSLRLKWEDTKSRSSYDRSFGWDGKIEIRLNVVNTPFIQKAVRVRGHHWVRIYSRTFWKQSGLFAHTLLVIAEWLRCREKKHSLFLHTPMVIKLL